MRKVVDYIENHLDSELDVKRLMAIAYYSEFHFHRLFRAYIGESVYAFKKRLLLERAVKQLRYSDESITGISLNCGYDSQSSFNKAFKKFFDVTPSQVRSGRVLIQLSPLRPNISLETLMSSTKLQAEVKTLKEISLIGAREHGSYHDAAPKAWGRIMKFAYSNRLMNKEVRLFGLSHDDPSVTNPEHIRYDACLDLKANIEKEQEQDLMSQKISAGRYLVILHKGSYDGLADVYSYAFNQWLPDSQYDLRDGQTCFEIYLNRDPRRTKPENLRTEVYIPLN